MTEKDEKPRRKSPAVCFSRALAAVAQAYEDDRRISEALDEGKEPDWAVQLRKIAAEPGLSELVEQMFLQNPDSPHCLLWAGNVDVRGYPRVRVYGRLQYTTRVCWQLFNHIQLPPGAIVRQTCGRRRCIRREHLVLDLKVGPLFQAGYGRGLRSTPSSVAEGDEGRTYRLRPPPDAVEPAQAIHPLLPGQTCDCDARHVKAAGEEEAES